MAIDIIQKTNDGDDLDPLHLKLVEMAVNGFLNAKGETAFRELHASVQAGYQKPWLHGVENLTIDHTGYVRWKGSIVEHYDISWAFSAKSEVQAQELGRRCAILEAKGIQPTVRTAIWEGESDRKEVNNVDNSIRR